MIFWEWLMNIIFTKNFFSRSAISAPSFFRCFKAAKIYLFIFIANFRDVFTARFIETNAFDSSAVVPMHPLMRNVLMFFTNPKIISSVIGCIKIYMIDHLVLSQWAAYFSCRNDAMERYSSFCVKLIQKFFLGTKKICQRYFAISPVISFYFPFKITDEIRIFDVIKTFNVINNYFGHRLYPSSLAGVP